LYQVCLRKHHKKKGKKAQQLKWLPAIETFLESQTLFFFHFKKIMVMSAFIMLEYLTGENGIA